MNITEIKAQISATEGFTLGTLSMVRQFNEDVATKTKTPTEWVSHWDNDHRVRVTMHQDIMQKLADDKSMATLALKREVVAATSERASYVRYVVITPLHIEATF